MGTTALTRDQKKLLTKKELDTLGETHNVEVPGNVRSKDDTIEVLEEAGVTNDQFHDELVRLNYLEPDTTTPPAPDAKSEADGDNSDNSSGSNDGPAPTPPAKPKAAPKAKTDVDDFDLDEFDPQDDIELPDAPQRDEQALLTEADIPKLKDIDGVYIRRIQRVQDHGGGRQTWWCPWSDASRLSPDDPSHLDQIDASKAIRLGRFAVVLPPQGIRPDQLR